MFEFLILVEIFLIKKNYSYVMYSFIYVLCFIGYMLILIYII